MASTSTYSIRISDATLKSVFKGHFVVNTTSGVVTSFYDDTNLGTNILAPVGTVTFASNDNSFSALSASGTLGHHVGVTSFPYLAGGSSPEHGYDLRYVASRTPGGTNFEIGYTDAHAVNQTFSGHFAVSLQRSPPCFNAGTMIDVVRGRDTVAVPIESIRRGDVVRTYMEGDRRVRKIGRGTMINAPDDPMNCMYVYAYGSADHEPLAVTGGHRVLLDASQVSEDERATPVFDKMSVLACSSRSFVKVPDARPFTYYHLCLGHDDEDDARRFVVYANGVLAETTYAKQFQEGGLTELTADVGA